MAEDDDDDDACWLIDGSVAGRGAFVGVTPMSTAALPVASMLCCVRRGV